MLVLSRKENEAIVIGNHIVVMVVEIHGDRIRLGIEAPKTVPVHRQEVYDAIRREQQTIKENLQNEEGLLTPLPETD